MTHAGDKRPKMDEILASIRRIVSDKGDAPRADAPDDPSETLELTPAMAEPAAPGESAATGAGTPRTMSDMQVRDYTGSQNTLEALVRQMLEPMLREWLDANLPEIVEKTVAREVARITKRGA